MDAQQALADVTEISSQIHAAVVFDDEGKIAGSTLGDEDRAAALAEGAARLLEQAREIQGSGAPLAQLEVATLEGSVFLVASGNLRIAATTAPDPTVGLVFYDLKSALRSISPKAAPRKRASATKKTTASAPSSKKPAGRKSTTARKKKTDAS